MYATMEDVYADLDSLTMDYVDRQKYIVALEVQAHGSWYLESVAMEGIISGTIDAIKSFASGVWNVIKGIKEMIFGKAESETKKLDTAEEKLKDADVDAVLDKPIEDKEIPPKKVVGVELSKALAKDQILGIAFGSLFFSKAGFKEKKELYQKAAAEFTTPLQSLVMDENGGIKVINKFKEITPIKTLRQGGWTKESILSALRDAKKAASPSNWKAFLGKVFRAIPDFFRALNKAPAPTAAVPKPSGVIVGFFKMWMKLFRGLIWNGTFGKIMFVVSSIMTIVSTVGAVKAHNADVDKQTAQKDASSSQEQKQEDKTNG